MKRLLERWRRRKWTKADILEYSQTDAWNWLWINVDANDRWSDMTESFQRFAERLAPGFFLVATGTVPVLFRHKRDALVFKLTFGGAA